MSVTKAKGLSYSELLAYARKHYGRGGDVVFECWDEATYKEYVASFGPITKKQALRMFNLYLSVGREFGTEF